MGSRELPNGRRPFTVLGVPIHVHSSWFFIVALVAWTLATRYFPALSPGLSRTGYGLLGGLAALLLFACVLVHELGHALVARRFGLRVARVTLFVFGGVAELTDSPRRPRVECLVAVAGPLISLGIAGACFALLPVLARRTSAELATAAVVHYLGTINVVLVVFNLLPGFPLDGGRILRAGLWAWSGSFLTATRIASALGSVVALALMALGAWTIIQGEWQGGLWYIILGGFLHDAAQRTFRRAKQQ